MSACECVSESVTGRASAAASVEARCGRVDPSDSLMSGRSLACYWSAGSRGQSESGSRFGRGFSRGGVFPLYR